MPAVEVSDTRNDAICSDAGNIKTLLYNQHVFILVHHLQYLLILYTMLNYKNYLLTLACFIGVSATKITAQPHLDSLFENPAIQEINRMPMRANYFPYENEALAKTGDTAHSERYLLLNGMWRFNWVKRPELLDKNFF